jgi:tetratricopeptide (TPR) repeat protein
MTRSRSAVLALCAALAVLGACHQPKKPVHKAESAVSSSERKQAEDLYIKGVYAYADGRTEEAIADWKQCLKLNPEHPKARQSLAEARAKQEAVKKLK